MKILMVCLGNICRSPIADGLLRQKVNEEHLDVEVDSAGTIGMHAGSAPDSRMITTAKNRGTDISFLKARQFTVADFDQFDVIFAMDKNNKHDILSLAKNAKDKQKVHLILSEISDQEEANVPDPYYGTSKDFEHVYELVDKATNTIIQKIKNNTLI
jgi:protein-tyrosine phosphatase